MDLRETHVSLDDVEAGQQAPEHRRALLSTEFQGEHALKVVGIEVNAREHVAEDVVVGEVGRKNFLLGWADGDGEEVVHLRVMVKRVRGRELLCGQLRRFVYPRCLGDPRS